MNKKTILLFLVLILPTISGGCVPPQAPSSSPSPSGEPPLTPFLFSTPTLTPTPAPLLTTTQEPQGPTPTPFTHTIEKGDTLGALALQYNTTVDAILAANPDANSNFLVVGEKLIIPIGEGENLASLPTATPVQIPLQPPRCYRLADESAYCFLKAENTLDTPLENIAALVSLYTPDGDLLAQETALSPLNITLPETTAPLQVYVPGPLPGTFQARGRLLTALPLTGDYPQTSSTVLSVQYTPEQEGALVEGQVTLSGAQEAVQEIWVVVVAYDQQDHILGLRKWTSNDPVSPGESLNFSLWVFSLGGPIDHIGVLSEAIP